MKFKLKLYDDLGQPLDLTHAEHIDLEFPYANNRTKLKTLKNGVNRLEKNVCEVELSDFELAALPESESISFKGKVVKNGLEFHMLFDDAFAIRMKKGRRSLEVK